MAKTQRKKWWQNLHPRVTAFVCGGSWWVQLDRSPIGGWSLKDYPLHAEERTRRAAKKLSLMCAGIEAKRG